MKQDNHISSEQTFSARQIEQVLQEKKRYPHLTNEELAWRHNVIVAVIDRLFKIFHIEDKEDKL